MVTWIIWTTGLEYAAHLQFLTTSNEAKYEVVISGLDLAKAAGAMSVVIHYNSQVVIGHINGDYKAKREWMREYLGMIKGKVSEGLSAKFVQILREENN